MATIILNPGSNVQSAINSASTGDVLSLNSGSYGSQSLTAVKTSPGVTIKSTTGQGASFSFLQLYRSAYLTFDSISLPGGVEFNDYGSTPHSNHITWRNCATSGANWSCNLAGMSNTSILIDGCTFGGYSSSGIEGTLHLWANPGSSALRGVTVTNCTFTGGMDADGIRLDTSGITVGPGNTFIGWIQNGYSVHVDAIQVYGGNSLTITGNYFRGNTINFGCYDSGDTVVVTNNIYDLPDLADSGHQDFQLSLTNARFEHNTFYHCLFAVGSKSGDPACTGWVVRNNIYVSTDMIATASAGGTPGFTGTSSYHLKDSASSLTPAGTNIITGSPTFIGGAHPATWAGWQLAAGSLGKNAGSDGADMGSTYYGSNENIPPIGTLSLSVR